MSITVTPLQRNLIQRANMSDCLRRSAALYPSRAALIDDRSSITFGELHRRSNQVARGLLARGIGRGDFVGLIYRNCTDFFDLYFACGRIGAIALPLNPHLREQEYAFIVGEAKPRLLVVFEDYVAVAESLAAQSGSSVSEIIVRSSSGGSVNGHAPVGDLYDDDDSDVEMMVEDRDGLQCIYTSGTTASPKGVITSHLAAIFTALTGAHHMRVQPGDVGYVPLPIHHVGGLNDTTLPHLVVGATVVLHDGWNAPHAAEAFERHRVNCTLITAPMWMELLALHQKNGYDWSAMKTCMVGIATLPPERGEVLRRVCPNADVMLASGQTEFTGFQECQTTDHQFTKPAAWGAPSLVTDVQIMDDDGNLLPPGVVGEIVYRGPQAMTEYFAQPALTEESFAHGWFHSGDLGYVDEDHTVFFVDRKKDMIKTGGENVASVEVAMEILALDGVADCAIVGLPHARWTEAITAFVQAEAGASLDEDAVRRHCAERLAPFKVPKRVLFTDDFPRTASGKIQKVKLREMYAALYDGD